MVEVPEGELEVLSSFLFLTESAVSGVVEGRLGRKTISTWLHMVHKLKKDLSNMM